MTKASPLPMRPKRWFGHIMEWFNAPTYRLALDLIGTGPGRRVMEIGFGSGRLLELLAQREGDVHLAGIDPTEAMVKMAKERASLRKLGDRLDLRIGTASSLPWKEHSFDTVTALHSFQFWEDPAKGLTEVQRVLRSSGHLILILRNHEKAAPDWLPNPISKSGDEFNGTLRLLKELGFTSVEAAGAAGSSKAILAKV